MNVTAGSTLTFEAVVSELLPVKDKWREIGTQLSIQENVLKLIASASVDNEHRLQVVISQWLSMNGRANWEALIQALKSPLVGEHHRAELLKRKYCSIQLARATSDSSIKREITPAKSSGAVPVVSTDGETTLLGLKRKQLHSDNTNSSPPLKLMKFEAVKYDPPNYSMDDFVTKQLPDFQCVYCKRVPRKPLRLKCCNTLYCEPCSIQLKTCPTHGQGTEYNTDTILRSRISKLTVRCVNGCGEKCAVYQMKNHLPNCKGMSSTVKPNNVNSANSSVVAGSSVYVGSMDVLISMEDRATPLNIPAAVTKMSTMSTAAIPRIDLTRGPLQRSSSTARTQGDHSSEVKPGLPSPVAQPELPPLAEVVPQPSLTQIQSELRKVVAILDKNLPSGAGSSQSVPASLTQKPTGAKKITKDAKLQPVKKVSLQVSPPSSGQPTLGVTGGAVLDGTKLKTLLSSRPGVVTPDVANFLNSVAVVAQKNIMSLKASVHSTTPSSAVVTATAPALSLATPSGAVSTTTSSSSSVTTAVLVTPILSSSVAAGTATRIGIENQLRNGSESEAMETSGGVDSLRLGEAFSLHPSIKTHSRNSPNEIDSASIKTHNQRKPFCKLQSLNLKDLEVEMKSAATKWRKFGRALNQPTAALESFAKELGNDPEKCLSCVLKNLFSNKTGMTGTWPWKSLLRELSRDYVGEKELAQRLKDKYGTNVKVVLDDDQEVTTLAANVAKSSTYVQTNLPFTNSGTTPTLSSSSAANIPPTSAAKVPPSSAAKIPTSSATKVPPSSAAIVPPSSATKVSPSSAAKVPPSSAAKVPPSSAAKVPPSSATKVLPSSAAKVPPSPAAKVPPSPAIKVPPSSAAKVPPSSASKVPPSSAAKVPPSSAAKVPPSSAAKVPPSSAAKVPPSSAANFPPSSAAKVPPSPAAKVPQSSATKVPSTSTDMFSQTATPASRHPKFSIIPLTSSSLSVQLDPVTPSAVRQNPLLHSPAATIQKVLDLLKNPAMMTGSVGALQSLETMEMEKPKQNVTANPIKATSVSSVPATSGTVTTNKPIPPPASSHLRVDKPSTTISPSSVVMATTASPIVNKAVHLPTSGTTTTQAKTPPIVGVDSTPAKTSVTKSPISVAVEVSKGAGRIIPDSELVTLSEFDFTMKPRKEIHCSKCKRIPLNPNRPKCSCNVVYCDSCAKAVAVCPLCNKSEGFEVDRAMRKRIWNLQVPCVYKSQGCDWKGVLSTRMEHSEECPKRRLSCKYKCLGCGELMFDSEVSAHNLAYKDKHLQLAMDTVVVLVDQVKALQAEVAELKNK